jgi:hypothetical protein
MKARDPSGLLFWTLHFAFCILHFGGRRPPFSSASVTPVQ